MTRARATADREPCAHSGQRCASPAAFAYPGMPWRLAPDCTVGPALSRWALGQVCSFIFANVQMPAPLRIAVFMLAGLVPTSLAAQTFAAHKVFGRYQQAVWQEPQGLPQHTVYAMTKTRDGYLWLATVEGAARFDGVRFTVFDPTNTPEIRGSVIATLVEDDDGTLWLGPDSGGLVRYSAGRFARVTTADGLIESSAGAASRSSRRAVDRSRRRIEPSAGWSRDHGHQRRGPSRAVRDRARRRWRGQSLDWDARLDSRA